MKKNMKTHISLVAKATATSLPHTPISFRSQPEGAWLCSSSIENPESAKIELLGSPRLCGRRRPRESWRDARSAAHIPTPHPVKIAASPRRSKRSCQPVKASSLQLNDALPAADTETNAESNVDAESDVDIGATKSLRRSSRRRLVSADIPSLHSAEEGAPAHATAAEIAADVDARLHLLASRRRRNAFDPSIEGNLIRWSADRGPLRCHCSGGIACGFPMASQGKEGNAWCQRGVKHDSFGCAHHSEARRSGIIASGMSVCFGLTVSRGGQTSIFALARKRLDAEAYSTFTALMDEVGDDDTRVEALQELEALMRKHNAEDLTAGLMALLSPDTSPATILI